MTIAQPPDPNLKWSFDLPVKLKCAIGDCITLYSKIESCGVEVVWTLEQAGLERKKVIAKAWGDENFDSIKKVVKSIPGAESDAIWPALRSIGKERNLIGHGVWMIGSDGRPLVVWHAKFLESDDWVGGEYFDYSRFDHFLERGQALLKTFTDFKAILEAGIADERAKRAAALPTAKESSMSPTTEPHWEAGYKYATEAIKILLTLNGGAAAGLLTFIGHTPELRNGKMGFAILAFGIGALFAAFDFACAYITQLHYGNRELERNPGAERSGKLAPYWHNAAYILFVASAFCFLIGLVSATCAIVNH